MKPQRLIPLLMSLALALSQTAAPAVAYAAFSKGFGEEAVAESVAEAQEKARELESKIDNLPDDAGLEYKSTVNSIYGQMQGSSSGYMYPPWDYMSEEHIAKLITIRNNILEAEKAESSAQATATQAAQTATTTTPTSTNAASASQPSSRQSSQNQDQGLSTVILIALIAWETIWIIQVALSYGTAYRKTKKGGDNGVALFGWMLVFSLASIIPGLGLYLWNRNR